MGKTLSLPAFAEGEQKALEYALSDGRFKDLSTIGYVFLRDTEKLAYIDKNKKVHIVKGANDIINLNTEAQRLSIKPITAFYYVSETMTLWRYENNVWNKVTGSRSEWEPIQ